MKDLDFDEIDRAVNSVNTSAPAENDNSENSTQPPQPPQTLARRRSSGQFMDVVHPSSDMRRAPLIAHDRPSIPDIKPPEMPKESSESIITPDNNPTEPSGEENWPDPIDFQKPSNDVVENEVANGQEQNEDADIDKISDDITNELSQKSDNESESPDSPFISGTKVEKRPLGAFSTEPATEPTTETTETSDKDEISEITETKNDETSESEIEPETTETTETTEKKDEPLPEELSDDLLQIESGEENSTTNQAEQTPEQTPIETPTIAVPTITTPTIKEETPAVESQPVGATSITQQYKEQPSTGDQNNGAIYNTDAYHKPLAKPVKNKSNWMWILWILILILVGVGVGVAIYKFVLPLL